MSSFNRFLTTTSLKRIPTKYLKIILSPIKIRLLSVNLWQDDETKHFDCNFLAKWIRDNTASMPQDILDAFFYINSLIKGRMHDRIFGELSRIGEAELGDEGVLASKIWCVNKTLAMKLHSEARVRTQHSFTFYKPKRIFQDLNALPLEKITSVEQQLEVWLENNNKGKKVDVFQHDIKGTLYFHILHGSTLRREPVIENNESTIAIIRSEIEDILFFNKQTGEIGIYLSEPAVRLENAYKAIFGYAFFEDDKIYVKGSKFSLDVVLSPNFAIQLGSLRDSIKDFRLSEIKVKTDIYTNDTITFSSQHDALTYMRNRSESIGSFSVEYLKFKILFSGEDKEKTITISSNKKAVYPPYCDHALIEKILILNGICIEKLKPQRTEENATKDLHLVGA